MQRYQHQITEKSVSVQARDRKKERSARTRRLILEGAELEKIVPEVKDMTTDELRQFLLLHLQKHF